MTPSKYEKGDCTWIVDMYSHCRPRIYQGVVNTVAYNEQYGYVYSVKVKGRTTYGHTEDELFGTEERARTKIINNIETIRL